MDLVDLINGHLLPLQQGTPKGLAMLKLGQLLRAPTQECVRALQLVGCEPQMTLQASEPTSHHHGDTSSSAGGRSGGAGARPPLPHCFT
ncbi:hypothetical protein PAMP_018026 [Pampus punctatissimus]